MCLIYSLTKKQFMKYIRMLCQIRRKIVQFFSISGYCIWLCGVVVTLFFSLKFPSLHNCLLGPMKNVQ